MGSAWVGGHQQEGGRSLPDSLRATVLTNRTQLRQTWKASLSQSLPNDGSHVTVYHAAAGLGTSHAFFQLLLAPALEGRRDPSGLAREERAALRRGRARSQKPVWIPTMVLLPLTNAAFPAAMPARVLELRLSKCLFRDQPTPPTASPLCCLLYLKNQHRNLQRRQGCVRSICANGRSSVRGSVRRAVAWPDSGVCGLPGPHAATQRRRDPVPPSPPGTTYSGSQTRPHMATLGNRIDDI